MNKWIYIYTVSILLFVLAPIPTLSAINATHVKDVCSVQKTDLHYAESKCTSLKRRVLSQDDETFVFKSVLISKDIKKYRDKKTLIILPGGPGNPSRQIRYELQSFDLINSFWSGLDLNVVLFDPRGTGSSPLNNHLSSYPKEVFSTQNTTEDLMALVQHLRLKKNSIYFLAHSAGGLVAVDFIKRYPDYIKGALMHSAILTPQQGFKLNAQLNSNQFELADQISNELYLIDHQMAKSFRFKYKQVEQSITQQFKARLLNLKDLINDKFPTSMSTQNLRKNLIIEYNKDREGLSAAYDFITEMHQYLMQMSPYPSLELFPQALKNFQISEEQMPKKRFYPNEHIKQAVLCGEGALAKITKKPHFYEGLTLDFLCEGVHADELSELNPQYLSATEFVFFAGSGDSQVPLHIQLKNAKAVQQSYVVTVEGAGHLAFKNSTMLFYNTIKDLISD